ARRRRIQPLRDAGDAGQSLRAARPCRAGADEPDPGMVRGLRSRLPIGSESQPTDKEPSMDGGDEIRQLLREIRDAQREQLAEYRRVTERSLELQQRAVARQEQIGQFSRRAIGMGGILVVALLALLVYLLARWWRYLFGV